MFEDNPLGLNKKFIDQRTLKLKDGEILFREGDLSREMYIVQSGAIEVFKQIEKRSVVLGQVDRGGMVGEMSLLESMPRSATVRAIGETSLLQLDLGGFLLKIRRDPTFAFELMKQLSGRIRLTNEKLLALMNANLVNNDSLEKVIESGL